jgi:hypothetical protein
MMILAKFVLIKGMTLRIEARFVVLALTTWRFNCSTPIAFTLTILKGSANMSTLHIRIDESKKVEFQQAIDARDPNLNMSLVVKILIDEYIKSVKGGK